MSWRSYCWIHTTSQINVEINDGAEAVGSKSRCNRNDGPVRTMQAQELGRSLLQRRTRHGNAHDFFVCFGWWSCDQASKAAELEVDTSLVNQDGRMDVGSFHCARSTLVDVVAANRNGCGDYRQKKGSGR